MEAEAAAREHVPRSTFVVEAQAMYDAGVERSEDLQALLDSKCALP